MDKELDKDIAVGTEAETTEDKKSKSKAEKEAAKKSKKEKYPSKTDINLYFKNDKTTKPVTLMLYGLFVLVVLLAVVKFGVYDMLQANKKLEEQIEEQEEYSFALTFALRDYDEVNAQYKRYTQDYLEEDEILQNRIELLNMLEETVFMMSSTEYVLISEDTILLSYTGLDLEQTAMLKVILEDYDVVTSVSVQAASLETDASSGYETVSTTMLIKLAPISETGGAN